MIEYYDYRLKTHKNDIGILFAVEEQLLRELTVRVKEIAMRPSQSLKVDRWEKHNKLEKVRPMVLTFPEFTEGCVVEMILKDTHTVEHKPERIEELVDIARKSA